MTRRPNFEALTRALLVLVLVATSLVPSVSPRVAANGASITVKCGGTTGPALPCSAPAGGTITISSTTFGGACGLTVSAQLRDLSDATTVATLTADPGPVTSCEGFFQGTFRVPVTVAAGDYRVRATGVDAYGKQVVSAVTPRATPLTVTSAGTLSGFANCGQGNLAGARVDLFSGADLVDTTTANAAGSYGFNVAPGTYTVRITLGTTVCGGPATPGQTPRVSTPIDLHNHSWPRALALTLNGTQQKNAVIDETVFRQDQSTWFKFKVEPGSRVIVTLTGGANGDQTLPLPTNYDLTLYKDIAQAYSTLVSPQDLVQLQAEFAPDAFSPDAFSPDAFSPDAFSPDAFSPDAFSPDAFSPDAFSPDAFSPDAFSPDAFSPDAFSPDAFSPDAFSPDAFSPDAFSPDAFSPDAFSGGETVSAAAYASAQTRSLIAVSAFDGTSGEGVIRNTWDNNSDFYVRVRGRNGAFSLERPFHLSVTLITGTCGSVAPITSGATLQPVGGDFRTLVLSDFGRLAGTDAEKSLLQSQLTTFAGRGEVLGKVVDITGDERVRNAKKQSDAHNDCPFAKNVLAGEIKRLVDGYRSANPALEYLVLIGNDDIVPFFRLPDKAGLASEREYAPPVLDPTASQASLKLSYVLTQDPYGARRSLARGDHAVPVPDLAIGRVVETAADVMGMFDAYLSTAAGVVATPTSALVTGYDFLADAADAVKSELSAGLGTTAAVDALIQPNTRSPTDPTAWTATQLRTALLGSRHDVTFLAGHFSQSSALAADFTTRVTTTELLASNVDIRNSIIFSAGCHSGYNTVDPHAVPAVTVEPDWAQAFARKGAAFIGGTGYQYGDTDFIEYSERLYLEFSRALHAGTEPVAIGNALVASKRAYLANTAVLKGIHEKALLEATLFGLPMLRVDMPAGRGAPPVDDSIVTDTSGFTTNPGLTLGLRSANVSIASNINTVTVPLTNTQGGGVISPPATYLTGSNGVVVNPAETVLPLEERNVSVADTVLRGVGFRGATYSDTPSVRPLTGASAVELRTPHVPFSSSAFYPIRPWSVNYYEALGGRATRLELTPSQFLGNALGDGLGTRRQFSSIDFRLYYSNNIATFQTRGNTTNTPGLSASPAISKVAGVPVGTSIQFNIQVGGDPAVGIQEVWVTYTATEGPFFGKWQSVNLTQGARPFSATNPSNRWTGTLALGSQDPTRVRYVVQAANGVGLVTLATNLGAYYIPGPDMVPKTDPKDPTQISLLDPVLTGVYREQVTLRANLTSNGTALAGRPVFFGIGPGRRQAVTDANGNAQTTMTLLLTPDAYELKASFQETSQLLGSFDTRPFTITKQGTRLALAPTTPPNVTGLAGGPTPFIATLSDASNEQRRLLFQTVMFVVSGGGRTFATASITDFQGRAPLGPVALPAGTYSVVAYFGQAVPVGNGQTVTLDNDRYNPSTSNTATLVLQGDATVPSCVLTSQGVDSQGRKFVEVTLQDTGAGLASVVPTANSANATFSTSGLSAITFAMGTTSPVVIRATKIDQSQTARVELKVTDAAVPANSLTCDPVITTLEVGKLGYSETEIHKDIPREEDTVTVRNTRGDRDVVMVVVNGQPFSVLLRNGEEKSINVASAMRKDDQNTFTLSAVGTPGSTVDVMIWDGEGTSVSGGRGFEPARPIWRELIQRLKRPRG
jgi:hypothetical protein